VGYGASWGLCDGRRREGEGEERGKGMNEKEVSRRGWNDVR
jgi:hypothetical protein